MTIQKTPKVITVEMPYRPKKNRKLITVDLVIEEFWYIVNRGRKVRISEIAQRLGCTKPPVANRLNQAVVEGKITQEEVDNHVDTRPLSLVHMVSKDTKEKILKELESFYNSINSGLMSKRRCVRIEDYYKHSKFSIEDINMVVDDLSINDRYFFFGDSLASKKKKETTVKDNSLGKQKAVKEVSMDKIITKKLSLKDDQMQNFLRNFAGKDSKEFIYASYREGA